MNTRIYCRHCGQGILPKDYVLHAEVIHQVMGHICMPCEEVFETADGLERHITRRHRASTRVSVGAAQQRIAAERARAREERRPEEPRPAPPAPPIPVPVELPPTAPTALRPPRTSSLPMKESAPPDDEWAPAPQRLRPLVSKSNPKKATRRSTVKDLFSAASSEQISMTQRQREANEAMRAEELRQAALRRERDHQRFGWSEAATPAERARRQHQH